MSTAALPVMALVAILVAPWTAPAVTAAPAATATTVTALTDLARRSMARAAQVECAALRGVTTSGVTMMTAGWTCPSLLALDSRCPFLTTSGPAGASSVGTGGEAVL